MKIKRIDKGDGTEDVIGWNPETYRRLRNTYNMTSSELLRQLEAGGILQTPFAIYKKA